MSFADNGTDPKVVPEIDSGQIRLNSSDSSTVFYRYSTYTGAAGQYSGSHTALSTSGLAITINSRTFLGPVTIVCSAPVSQPSLTGITPNTGTTTGGSSVTITGTNLTGATSVSMGGVAATNINVVSSTSITATTPAHAAGLANVAVTTPGGTDVLVNSFTYVAPNPPVANAVSATVAAGSSANPITLDVTGGAATSVAIDTAASHGTATASGTFITYTPTTGYSGPDSFTYTASNADGTSTAATVSITVSAAEPTLTGITPNMGATAGGTSITITGTKLTGATSVIVGGVAATNVSVVSSTSITATTPPHAAGSVNVAVTTPGGTDVLVNGFTYVAPNPPVANAVSATVAAGSSANPITLDITGGTATSVAVDAAASHGTATASGTFITYTPTTGYSGPDSFTYTASNADGTSTAATVSITVSAAEPTLTGITPNMGATAGGTSITINGTNLTGATGVSIGGVAATGITVLSSTTIAATTPAHAAGLVNVLVTTQGGSDVLVNSFTYVAPNPPVANAVSATVAAGSSANPIALDITGGTATSIAIDTAATHGTATVSGISVTYTPTSGYSGPDSFTYTASNADGTSAAATVSINVSTAQPTITSITPNAGTTAGGTSVTITGTNVTGATGVNIGGVAATNINVVSSTSITATIPAHAAGLVNISVTTPGGTDVLVNGFTYEVEPIVISPASGELSDAKVGTAYNQTLALTGGTAPFAFGASGSIPSGITVNPTTGAVSGTPTSTGNYNFTVMVTDANNTTASVAYALAVAAPSTTFTFAPSGGPLTVAMVGESYSQQITATGGTGALIYNLFSGSLPNGMTLNVSTGELTGPLASDTENKNYSFTIQVRDGAGATGTARYTLAVAARAVTVTDKVVEVDAGSSPSDVYLNRGATGGPFVRADMTFVEPSNAGTATIIQGQLAQSGPVTTPVGWYLQFTPNPAYKGQARVGFRLTSALGISNTGTVTYNIAYDAEQVASDTDRLVRSFVRSRQNMISSTIHVPGLLERRRMTEATDPVTARMTPSENGMTVGFSTSLAQMESARDSTDGIAGGYSSAFNIWIDGAFLAHNDKDINGGKWGSFAILNMGADYLLNERALIGLSLHYDYMTDPTDEDAELKGNGWLAGPYASFEIGKGVFLNGSLLYGGSSNNIDTQFWEGSFDTKRWMADTSVEGQLDLGNDTTLTPKLRAVYFSEKVDEYTIRNAAGDLISIDDFNEEQFRVSLGAEIARSFDLENGATFKPNFGVTGGFAAFDGSGAFGTAKAGVSLQTQDLWVLDASLLLTVEGDGQKSLGARVAASRQF